MKTSISLMLFSVLFFTGLSSCKSVKRKQAEQMKISYGSGGGFTGETTEYILKGSGEWMKIRSLSRDTLILKPKKYSELKEIFTLASSEKLAGINLKEYANMSRFIRIYRNGDLLREFVWPVGKMDLPADLAQLNSLLLSLKEPS